MYLNHSKRCFYLIVLLFFHNVHCFPHRLQVRDHSNLAEDNLEIILKSFSPSDYPLKICLLVFIYRSLDPWGLPQHVLVFYYYFRGGSILSRQRWLLTNDNVATHFLLTFSLLLKIYMEKTSQKVRKTQ